MSDKQKGPITPRWGEIKEEGEAWTWGRVVREANAVGNDWSNALTADQVRVLGNDIKLLMKRMRDDHVRRIYELEKEQIGAKNLHAVVQLGYELSTWAASINWDRSTNSVEWFVGLKELIEAYQKAAEPFVETVFENNRKRRE